MLPYILHVAFLVVSFFLLYKFLLEKETFFALHRCLLLVSITLAFTLPFFEIPSTWSLWQSEIHPSTIVDSLLPSSVSSTEATNLNSQTETTIATNSENMNPTLSIITNSIWTNLDWRQTLYYLYWIGAGIFGINLLIQFGTLLSKIIRLPSLKDEGFRIVELDKDEPPYSFWNCVFINPEKYDWDTYNQIIEHEKIHIQQMHSLDMLLAELLVVFQWFNPAAWQYRKLIENNLEFLTDHTMLRQGAPRENYQLNLLKVSVPQYPIGLAMNYNQSFLKKRINMMNVKKSSVRTSWKYLLLLPVLGLSIISLNAVQAANSEKQVPVPNTVSTNLGESKAKTSTKTDTQNAILLPETTTTVTGSWFAERKDNEVCLQLQHSKDFDRGYNWTMTRCFAEREFTNSGTSKLVREAGTLDLNDILNNGTGSGRFSFNASEDFKSYLKKEYGYSNLDNDYMIHLFMSDINKAYLQYLKQKGYSDISKSRLQELAIHGLDMDYLKKQLTTLKSNGFETPSLGKLIELRIHGVSDEYIAEMGSIGFKNLSLRELLEGRIHGVRPEYVKEIRDLGYKDFSFRDFIEFRIHGVNKEVAESLAKVGFRDLSAQKIKEASIHGVTADYIKSIQKAGYDLQDIQDLIEFKIHGVYPEFIASLADFGYRNISAHDLKSAAIHGVRTNFIKEIRALGFSDMSIDDAVSLRIHGVTPTFIKKARSKGYKDLSLDEYRNLKIMGKVY